MPVTYSDPYAVIASALLGLLLLVVITETLIGWTRDVTDGESDDQ